MREYRTIKEAEEDKNLNLRYIWTCTNCINEQYSLYEIEICYKCNSKMEKTGHIHD